MPGRLKINNLVFFILLATSLSGCVSIYNPATERREFLLIDTESEVALGRDIDKQLHKKLKILDEPRMLSRLNDIGNKVATASDRQDLVYFFRIVQDKELNAFAIPGGFVYVHSGLMYVARDDELAGVLSHEIGHIAARHSVKQLQTALGYRFIMGIALGITGEQAMGGAMDIVFNVINLGYSRQDELQADKLAVRYSRRSGFNPYGIVTFFEKLKKEVEARGPNLKIEFLSSHPDLDERIKKVEGEIKLNP
jgi:predicted Zn-dependent protease